MWTPRRPHRIVVCVFTPSLMFASSACTARAPDPSADTTGNDSQDDESDTTDSSDDATGGTASGDGDGDGDADAPVDLCPETPELDLEDTDQDGVGDACDNCPAPRESYLPAGSSNLPDARFWVRNFPWQHDADADGVGDLCDVCVTVSDCIDNPSSCQADLDSDMMGDACAASEADGSAGPVGWALSDDFDQDGLENAEDHCPRQPVSEQSCATDEDCPEDASCASNLRCNHADVDGDGVGNACDSCPFNANPDQLTETGMTIDDEDGDGVGISCETAHACTTVADPRPVAFYEVAVEGYCCVTTRSGDGQYVDLGDGQWGCEGHCDPQGLPVTRDCDNEPETPASAIPDGQLCRRLPDAVQAPNVYGVVDLPPRCSQALEAAQLCDPGSPDCDPAMANAELDPAELDPGDSLLQHLCVLPQRDADFDGYGDACDAQPQAFGEW